MKEKSVITSLFFLVIASVLLVNFQPGILNVRANSTGAVYVDSEVLEKVSEDKTNFVTGFAVIDNLIARQSNSNEEIAVIVELKDDTTKSEKEDVKDETNFETKQDFKSFNGFSGNVSVDELQDLINNENVEAIYYDKVFTIDMSDTKILTNATSVWPLLHNNINLTGAGQTVCILDTGINYNHLNLGSAECSGASFPSNCSRVIGGYDYVNSDGDPNDDQGHGTHVAGTIASNHETYTGIAPGANIAAIKVCNAAGSCSTSNILSGFDWCISNRSIFNISVISMSIGGGLSSGFCDGTSSFASSINVAVSKNISVVAAAGNGLNNDGNGRSDSIAEPACVQNATAVSSVDKSDNIASYSNRGANLTDLFAFGSSITSTYTGGGFTSKSGTSMATPHVSGAILLLQQYKKLESNRLLTPAEVIFALNNTGKIIADSATGVNYSRIKIYDAIVSIDVQKPLLTINSPLNTSYNYNNSIALNYSATDTNLQNVFYSLDSGVNISLSGNVSLNGNITLNVSEGGHNLIVYANDSAGNINITIVNFNVDLTAPYVAFVSPVNGNFSRNILVEITNNSDAVNIWFFNGTANQSYSAGEVYLNLSDGNYNLIAYANDSSGNLNYSSANISADTTAPAVIVVAPSLGNYFNSGFNANISVSDGFAGVNYTNIYYRIENSSNNYSWNRMSNYSLTEFNASVSVSGLGDGTYYLRFNASDSLGNINNSARGSFILDIAKPYYSAANTASADSSSVTITFSSNEGTNLTINYGSVVSLGTKINSASFVIAHSNTISSLSANTTYFYNLTFCDQINNCNLTGGYNFTTSAVSTTQSSNSASASVSAGAGAGGGGGGGGSGSGTNGVAQSWASMDGGKNYEFAVAKSDYNVEKVLIKPNKALGNVQVIVRKVETKPSDILREPINLNSYFQIIKEGITMQDISSAQIYFNVDKNWADTKGGKDKVKALRYAADKWEKLDTKFVSEANGKYTFVANTPGFSYFAIISEDNSAGKINGATGNIAANGVNNSDLNVGSNSTAKEKDNKNKIINVSKISKGVNSFAAKYWWIFAVVTFIILLIGLVYYFSDRLVK